MRRPPGRHITEAELRRALSVVGTLAAMLGLIVILVLVVGG